MLLNQGVVLITTLNSKSSEKEKVKRGNLLKN